MSSFDRQPGSSAGQLIQKQQGRHAKKPLGTIPKPATFSSHSTRDVTADIGRIGASEILVPGRSSRPPASTPEAGQTPQQRLSAAKAAWNSSTKASSTTTGARSTDGDGAKKITPGNVRRFR